MQMGIVMSHLSYATSGILLFMLCNRLGTSIIAMFFFVSGYGLAVGLRRSGAQRPLSTLPRRLWGIGRPYLMVLAIYIALVWADTGALPSYSPYALLRYGHTLLPNSWFVFVLLYHYLLFAILFSWLGRRPQLASGLLCVGSILAIAVCYALGYERAWWVSNLAFCTGVVYAQSEWRIYSIAHRGWAIVASAVVVAGIVASGQELLLPLAYIFIPITAIALLDRLGYSRWIDQPGRGGVWRIMLGKLSQISYELYLVHGVAIVMLRGRHIYIDNDYLFACAVIGLSIAGAYFTHQALEWPWLQWRRSAQRRQATKQRMGGED